MPSNSLDLKKMRVVNLNTTITTYDKNKPYSKNLLTD